MKKILTVCLFFAAALSLTMTSCDKEPTIDPTGHAVADEADGVVIGGVMWAKFNVDAPGTFAPYAESTGMYYQWNRPKGYSSADQRVPSDWDESQDEGDVWAPENDPCPAGWRVPTSEEFVNLLIAGAEWSIRNGVKGIRFGSGENTVFFATAGNRTLSGEVINEGRIGTYWAAENISVSRAMSLSFAQDYSCYPDYKENKAKALPVRCVAI
jgi:uncharacterized protein (TIGR02145 family)